MPNIDQVQLPDGSQYNLKDNISGYVTAGYVDDAIDGLTKADVGLGNVDNTSDLNKPVSTAQQTALNGKTDTTVIAPTEATTTASRRYEIGEQFILNGVLYTATAVIASGDTIIVNTNCTLSESITEQLKDIDLSANNVTFDNTGTDLVSENVEGAIKEVNEKTKHGIYECWSNSNVSSNFAGQAIEFNSNIQFDALDFVVEIDAGEGKAPSVFSVTKDVSSSQFYYTYIQSGTGASAYLTLAVLQRNVSIAYNNGKYTITFGDCARTSKATNVNTSATVATDNSKFIPIQIRGLIHND